MDIFRIFDALNWVPNMKVAMEAVLKARRRSASRPSATPGDILNPERTKYNLKYYVDLAKELEKLGANILAIKDMAGLCKPYAAELLVKTLKQEDRHPDPLPHARHRRHAGGRGSESGGSEARHRRRRDGGDVAAAPASRTSTRSSRGSASPSGETGLIRRAAR